MQMTKRIILLSLAILMATPQSAFAYRRIFIEQKVQEEESKNQLADPLDPTVIELLDELAIDIAESDPIWFEYDFARFLDHASLMLDAEKNEDWETFWLEFLEAADLAVQLDHPALVEDGLDQELVDVIREAIEADQASFEANPSEYIFGYIFNYYAEQYESDFEEWTYSVYDFVAWVSPSTYLFPGELARLEVDTYGEEGVSVFWEQLTGPQITLMNTDSETAKAFIVPQEAAGTEIEFLVTLSFNGESREEVLVITVSETSYNDFTGNSEEAVDPIEQLYLDVLGRPSDPDGYQYWSDQYNAGMSLEDIRWHFMQSAEYETVG